MLSSRRLKIIFGLVLIIFFALFLYFCLAVYPLTHAQKESSDFFIIFLGFILVIILSYLIFGKWAFLFTVVGLMASGSAAIHQGEPMFFLFWLPFTLSSLICQNHLIASSSLKHKLGHKLTELKREINQLGDELNRNKELSLLLQGKLDRYLSLKELTELLSSSLNLKELVHFIADETYKIIGKSERLLLYLIDESMQELVLTGYMKLDIEAQGRAKKGDIFDRWVLEHRRPLMIADIAKDSRFSHTRARFSRRCESIISAPLMLEDRILGVLRLEAVARNSYTADDLRILYVIASISAVAINNAYLYSKTEELAIKDSLTGLYVHRYFKERLKDELKRATRREHKFSLLMADIDYFKHYNDKYGHSVGDIVLQHIAKSLQKFAHTGDVIARYGGEEFALILTGDDEGEAGKIAEQIRKHISKDSVLIRGYKTHVTVSIGTATYPQDGKDEDKLIRAADKNLYMAKKEGRNKVCS